MERDRHDEGGEGSWHRCQLLIQIGVMYAMQATSIRQDTLDSHFIFGGLGKERERERGKEWVREWLSWFAPGMKPH